MPGRKLTQRQVAGIVASRDAADGILEGEPGTARLMLEDYREGERLLEIAEKYIPEQLERSRRVAINTVHCLIRSLIPEEELRELEKEHRSRWGKKAHELGIGAFGLEPEERLELNRSIARKGGEASYRKGVGIHGLGPEERSAAGKKGGRSCYENRAGIHGLSPERRSEISRKAGRMGGEASYRKGAGVHKLGHDELREAALKGLEARGISSFDSFSDETGMTEGEYALHLSGQEEYRLGNNFNTALIARELNSVYRNSRSVRAVGVYLGKHREGPAKSRSYSTFSEKTGMTEGEFIVSRSKMPEFRRGSLVRTSLIAREANSVYRNNRTMQAVSKYLCEMRDR